ncbi:FAD-dependent oxidoreductase [Bacteroides thetaiotaomicron]|nr:FAD-dependent oxidoreductase [Bacteroides thetaiotaomicron]
MNKSLIYLIGIIISFISINNVKATSDSTRVHKWYCLGTGSNEMPERSKTVDCDVAVIGAGMSGISVAVAAARQGADVVLINDRPVLGGNVSSEIRVTVNGVQTLKAKNPVERETGIIEEILLLKSKQSWIIHQ